MAVSLQRSQLHSKIEQLPNETYKTWWIRIAAKYGNYHPHSSQLNIIQLETGKF